MTGAGGLKRVPDDFYLNLVWPLPSISEQIKIVGFLNNEIEKIDALIERQERLVELLNEKRLEVIRHAITKGIDPDVRLKESRIQWIGKVPEGWAVKQLKWITPIKRGASPRPIDDPIYFDDENGEYAWVRISDVTSSNIYLEQTEQKLSALGASLSVKLEPGKLFLSIAGSVGKPCIAKIKACIHDGFVYFPKFNGNNMWLYYMFETKLPFGGLGKMGTQLNLNTDTIGSIYVPMPPENEIEKIISHIEEKFAKFNMLISKSNKSIELLKEHRSSLISAAVTGKIDVREVA
ncbi:restriction endonuclease subunit S [Polynucleobacter sp. 78F-HAINBA]|nr:restriction endonuclease subunit S [Polynucleobacter sp. 78F-HAINBA]